MEQKLLFGGLFTLSIKAEGSYSLHNRLKGFCMCFYLSAFILILNLFLLCDLVTLGIKKTKARAQTNRADISVICRIF